MPRKPAVAGLIVGAVLGAVLMAAPAQADVVEKARQKFNQNLQVLPVQVCNANVAVLGATVVALSPQTTGDCVNGPISGNLSSDAAWDAIPRKNGAGG
ncbi:hypothetical protein [Marinitenerispora sediminis]|uniref:DUF320 domain-containing protein n=1 Tax=Marinitenerispora sediminis TaxID=1931232 RepID=A0A368T0G2_9ACTN|nr:hypothetical protein [Marinitenerispora sediminis]RCV52769.1 hypothetical protein DEF24_21525 [Marinitenerispora sediminis]RCV55588.1 hypothetical protein DEF28_05695 [Marinitenerispora sediminis]RCV61916.1 hypothetical protein DEF23_01135 [Marinitenerispora sediminis]